MKITDGKLQFDLCAIASALDLRERDVKAWMANGTNAFPIVRAAVENWLADNHFSEYEVAVRLVLDKTRVCPSKSSGAKREHVATMEALRESLQSLDAIVFVDVTEGALGDFWIIPTSVFLALADAGHLTPNARMSRASFLALVKSLSETVS